MWESLKAQLLEIGTAKLTDADTSLYRSTSTAGPGAGGRGSVFFNYEGHRIRFAIAGDSPITLRHIGEGTAMLTYGCIEVLGKLEEPGSHCPGQAYITISGSCIFHCRYCPVPQNAASTKSTADIVSLVRGAGDIQAISLTSGVAGSIEEGEQRTLDAVKALLQFSLPIGVSIYPLPGTAHRLHEAGVAEVKFNLETATPELFAEMCPDLDRDVINTELDAAVALFGKNHVFTNLIFGLGESDAQMEAAIDNVCRRGIIPAMRPFSPAAELKDRSRPGFKRFMNLYAHHRAALATNNLITREAKTMCIACAGCDMVPGRD
ncbi:MAG: radical SAM protein [Methanocalculaceae archaeon]|jgi:biotin synthase-related radical SAM superfamily protein|nr:radical SAM protein [Methanocalculaceae archaeon]